MTQRAAGEKVGVVKLRCYRPFPAEELVEAVSGAKKVIVIEKAVSMGGYGIVTAELKEALYGKKHQPAVHGAVAGLGGRDITMATVDEIKQRADAGEPHFWAGLRQEILEEA